MGSYVNTSLIRDENVVYEAKNHWIIFISPLIENWTSEYAITNKRVIIKIGLISRKTLEMNLSKIESVNVDQSIFGRLLGYGAITIIGTGGTRETFSALANPIQFRRVFQECVDAH
jgi:uncharacterized membrane protein YdbT with pleckstrin-like domain